jgi:hypothetical protein
MKPDSQLPFEVFFDLLEEKAIIGKSIPIPDSRRMAVKLAASMVGLASASRQSTEFPANAKRARKV